MTDNKVALITGVTGQDGSYLAELLLSKDYKVHGLVRRSSSFNTERINHLIGHERFHFHHGDVSDMTSLVRALLLVRPAEIYHLGAQSHVRVSFEQPMLTADVTGVGTMRLLEAIRMAGMEKTVRFYQASSSEQYGRVLEIPQTESTPFNPQSPYACAKTFAHFITVNYREAYGMYAVAGLLYNHESPRRGPTFVTRKIARAVAAITRGEQDVLYLGNLDARRDWGHARDYVEGMWRMLQQPTPDDFVLATGESHSVRDFCVRAFARVGRVITWRGERGSVDEVGVIDDVVRVRIDARYFRPSEVEFLQGDSSKARSVLDWTPTVTFEQLVDEMVDAEMKDEME